MSPDGLLLRQVHPSFLQSGRPTSQVFRPTPKDEQQLSVYDGGMINAQGSFEHYTQSLGMDSDGVLGLSVAECAGQSLPVLSNPAPYPEHCVIDFSGLEKKVVEAKAKELSKLANARAWLYRATHETVKASPALSG